MSPHRRKQYEKPYTATSQSAAGNNSGKNGKGTHMIHSERRNAGSLENSCQTPISHRLRAGHWQVRQKIGNIPTAFRQHRLPDQTFAARPLPSREGGRGLGESARLARVKNEKIRNFHTQSGAAWHRHLTPKWPLCQTAVADTMGQIYANYINGYASGTQHSSRGK